MSDSVTDALTTPLSDLRALWLEAQFCAGPVRSPIWYHAARWPRLAAVRPGDGSLMPKLRSNAGIGVATVRT